MGVGEDHTDTPLSYYAEHLTNPDKIQLDFATQCASMFNTPVRPRMDVEKISGKTVLIGSIVLRKSSGMIIVLK